jgi:hypothetical protein
MPAVGASVVDKTPLEKTLDQIKPGTGVAYDPPAEQEAEARRRGAMRLAVSGGGSLSAPEGASLLDALSKAEQELGDWKRRYFELVEEADGILADAEAQVRDLRDFVEAVGPLHHVMATNRPDETEHEDACIECWRLEVLQATQADDHA